MWECFCKRFDPTFTVTLLDTCPAPAVRCLAVSVKYGIWIPTPGDWNSPITCWQANIFYVHTYFLRLSLFALWLLPGADDEAWWHRDPIRDWQQYDPNSPLPHLTQLSLSEKSWMVGDWRSFDSLSADHVMIESEIQHWLNEYIQLHSPDRRTLRKMLFLPRLHVKNECFLCWTNHQSHLGTILSGKRNKFKEISNYSVSRISPLLFIWFIWEAMLALRHTDIFNFRKRNKIP